VLREAERISPGVFVEEGETVRFRFGVRSPSDEGGSEVSTMPFCAAFVGLTMSDVADSIYTPPARSKEWQVWVLSRAVADGISREGTARDEEGSWTVLG
jgi:hypothetical protein